MVLICDTPGEELVFFHAPKCAGEAVNDALEEHFASAMRYNGSLSGDGGGTDVMHVTPDTCVGILARAAENPRQHHIGHKGKKILGRPREIASHMERRLRTHFTFTVGA